VLKSLHRRKRGQIVFKNIPLGTQIWIDGRWSGVHDASPRAVIQGLHWVKLVRGGSYLRGSLIKVQPGQVHAISGPMMDLPGYAELREQEKHLKGRIRGSEGTLDESALRRLARDHKVEALLVVHLVGRKARFWAVRDGSDVWSTNADVPTGVNWSDWVRTKLSVWLPSSQP